MKTPIVITLALRCAVLASAADLPATAQPSLEAQLAEAKAQIAVYEKLVTQSNDLMQKQLPALQAEVDGLSKPLAIGEDAGFMQLADGRKFEHVTITAITPTNITIRCGREMASIPWKSLPRYFQVRAAHAVVAAANTEATPSAPVVESAIPEGDSVYIGPIALRLVEGGGEEYTYFAWTAKVGNPTEYGSKRRPDITFFDREGFKIESALGEEAYIPPKSFRILTGKSLMKTVLWKQIDKYEVVLK